MSRAITSCRSHPVRAGGGTTVPATTERTPIMEYLQAMRGARMFVCALFVAASGCAHSTYDNGDPRPYDGTADANAAIAAALADNPQRKRVLLTFGANWCSDSRALERHYRSPQLADLLAR